MSAFDDLAPSGTLRVGIAVGPTIGATEQPLVAYTYDYLCDLVHPNKLLVERDQKAMFDIEGHASLGMGIFDKSFPLVVKLCSDRFSNYWLSIAK